MLGFILGTMTGGVMGVFAMCLFIAGKREDEALERCRMKRKEIIDHGVCICFVNSQGEELFRLADGESLVQNAPNGERNVSTCHYLDADSAMIDGKKWNLLEFAKEMEKRWKREGSCSPRWCCARYRKGGEAHMKKKIIAAAVAIGVLAGFLIWKNREM